MISNLQAHKVYFEQLFIDNWQTTPIQFVGEEFNFDSQDRWVNPFYSPSHSESKGLGSLTNNYGRLRVACWAENDLEVMTLTDEIIAFMNTNSTSAYRVLNYTIEDHAWHRSNQVYVVVLFNLEIFEGIC